MRTSWLTLLAQRGDRVEARLGVGAVQRGERQARGDFLLDAGIRFHAEPLAQQRHGRVVQRPQHVPHRVQPHRRVRARQREVRHGGPQRAPQAVVRADFGQAVRGGGSGVLQRQRIDQIEGIRVGRLDDEDLLIAVAEVETVFQERREDGADARMAALAQPFDDARLVGVSRPRAARRASARKVASVGWAEIGRVRELRPKGRAAAEAATARPTGGVSLLVVLS